MKETQNKRAYMFAGHEIYVPELEPALYLVSTPIGNLGDISLRALETLAAVDIIAAEDTRVSRKLLNHFAISAKVISYHQHNQKKQDKTIISAVSQGKAVALVCDAGTPVISDPGQQLIAEIHRLGLPVTAIPGASAPIMALSLSGLGCDRFTFVGFPPAKKGQRNSWLREQMKLETTLVLFCAPRMIKSLLHECTLLYGAEHHAMIGRELTKKFETLYQGTLKQLADNFNSEMPKGEFVIVLAAKNQEIIFDEQAIAVELRKQMLENKPARAVSIVAKQTGMARKRLYEMALEIKENMCL